MYRLRTFLLSILLPGFFACNNRSAPAKDEMPATDSLLSRAYNRQQQFFRRYETASQLFTLPAGKTSTVTGKAGTIISVNPVDLETTDGQPVSGSIQLELKELTTQRQLALTDAQTVSDGRLLVSDGAYYIGMKTGAKSLQLKAGRKLKVQFPKMNSTGMQLFYGNRDGSGNMNWRPAGQPLRYSPPDGMERSSTNDTDIVSENAWIDSVISFANSDTNNMSPQTKTALKNYNATIALASRYEAAGISQLGWINCDRFYGESNLTRLAYKFARKDSVTVARIYLIFSSINSVMRNDYILIPGYNNDSTFHNIPAGAKTRLIVVALKDGQPFVFTSNITIQKNRTVEISLRPSSEQEIPTLFN